MINVKGDPARQDRLWHKTDVAAYCVVSERTIENWMKRGLPYIKFGNVVLFKPEDVRGFLDRHRHIANPQC